ncbi:MAG: hypothetical protein ABJN69_07465 [Hellea sp.]
MSMTSNKMNRRRVLSQIASLGAVGATIGLAGCSTLKAPKLPPAPQLNKLPPFVQIIDLLSGRNKVSTEEHIRLSALPITHPDRAKEFNKIWRRISRDTNSIPISDKRLRIDADGTLFGGENISEQNFFIRAAAETLKAGHDGFVVVHLDYFSPGPDLLKLVPDMNFSSRRWIGNYEDFLDNRNEQNMFSSRGKVEKKGLDGVIYMLNADDHPNRSRFSANEIYNNLINYRAH